MPTHHLDRADHKTAGRVLAAVLMVASLIGIAGESQASSMAEDWTDRGLGSYGPTGEIDALNGNMPEVSAATLALANSPQLAAIRADWHDTEDFLSQVGYQRTFRESYDFLDSSPDHIAGVLGDKATASKLAQHELGLYLTDAEWDEFDRRVAAMRKSSEVRAAIVGPEKARAIAEERPTPFGPDYGGRWQDHFDDGVVKIGIVEGSKLDLAALRALMDRPSDVEFVPVQFSWDELQVYTRLVTEAASSQGIDVKVSPHAPANQVIVTIPEPGLKIPEGIPQSAVKVIIDPEALDIQDAHTNFNSDHSVLLQSPGLRIFLENTAIGFGDGNCTWGMTGHTASFNYIVTAGHCVIDPPTTSISGNKNMQVWQYGTDGTRISDTNPWVVAKDQALSDSARIQADAFADTNCYHTETSSCGFTMTSRRSLYEYDVGQTVCAAFARSNDYRCPNITELVGSYFSDYRIGFERQDGIPQGGDSGSGMKFSKTWDGIYYAGNATTSYFYPSYSVKTHLSFDFNCVRGGSSASGWLTCPLGNPN